MNKVSISKVNAILVLVIVILIVAVGWLAYKDYHKSNTVALSNSQIYNNVASQFGLQRSSLTYFRIFGQDKVQYSTGDGTTFAYSLNGSWHLAEADSQSAVPCSQLTNVPENFRPACFNGSDKLLYVGTNNTNLNYPIASAVSYIGQ